MSNKKSPPKNCGWIHLRLAGGGREWTAYRAVMAARRLGQLLLLSTWGDPLSWCWWDLLRRGGRGGGRCWASGGLREHMATPRSDWRGRWSTTEGEQQWQGWGARKGASKGASRVERGWSLWGRFQGVWVLSPPKSDFQPLSPGTYRNKSTMPRHFPALEFVACVVRKGGSSANQGPQSGCLAASVVWPLFCVPPPTATKSEIFACPIVTFSSSFCHISFTTGFFHNHVPCGTSNSKRIWWN